MARGVVGNAVGVRTQPPGAGLLGFTVVPAYAPKPYGSHREHDRSDCVEELKLPAAHCVQHNGRAVHYGSQNKQRKKPFRGRSLVSHDENLRPVSPEKQ